jgi:hypothetical protein
MSSLLPYEQYSIETALSPAQVAQALAAQVRTRTWINRWTSGAPYEGRVESYWFEIRRVMGWWTKARPPAVTGSVRPTALGSTIDVTIRPDTPQIVGLLLVPVLMFAFSLSVGARALLYMLPFGAIIFLIAYVSITLRFAREAEQARSFLQGALNSAELYAGVPAGYPSFPPTQQLPGGWTASGPQGYAPPYADGHDTQRLPAEAGADWYNADNRSARR